MGSDKIVTLTEADVIKVAMRDLGEVAVEVGAGGVAIEVIGNPVVLPSLCTSSLQELLH